MNRMGFAQSRYRSFLENRWRNLKESNVIIDESVIHDDSANMLGQHYEDYVKKNEDEFKLLIQWR